MPRRASSGIQAGQIAGLAIGMVFIIAVLFLTFRVLTATDDETQVRRSADADLNIQDYMENANQLRGNAYRVAGRVEERLKWTPERGRLISVDVTQGTLNTPVPILVPEEFNASNIEKGADMAFVVEVQDGGLLVATSVEQN